MNTASGKSGEITDDAHKDELEELVPFGIGFAWPFLIFFLSSLIYSIVLHGRG